MAARPARVPPLGHHHRQEPRHRPRAPYGPAAAGRPGSLEELTYFAGHEDTADRAIESIATDRALNLIGSLPPDQAEAVLLRVVAGLTARGAARVAGKRTGAIRTAPYRGLKRLAKRLERSQAHPRPR